MAGPPYLTDDPEPTDYQHFEIYSFSNGTVTRDGTSGEGGIDFNYGAAPNLQLTTTLPVGYGVSPSGPLVGGLSNIELAAKYRFLMQDNAGLDVSFFPRVFLPSASSNVGEQHASFLLPIWMEKDWGQWSAFGGGGCEINRGGDSQDFCLMGAVLTRQIVPNLQVGLELFHQTSDTRGGEATTSSAPGSVTTSTTTTIFWGMSAAASRTRIRRTVSIGTHLFFSRFNIRMMPSAIGTAQDKGIRSKKLYKYSLIFH